MRPISEQAGIRWTLALSLIGIVVAAAVGALIAVAPSAALGAIGLLVAAAAGTALLLGPRLLARVTTKVGAGFYLYVPAALLFASLVQILNRPATSSSLGVAALYEFALQGAAVGLIVLGIQERRLRFRLSTPGILWGLVGFFAMLSAVWAPSEKVSLLKGGQLLILGVFGTVLSVNFPDRETIARFLGRFAAVLFALLMLFQAVTQGPGSLYRTYEIGNPMYVDGRVRLSLLAIYPLTLGLVTGALILLLLVSRPRLADWIAIIFLGVINYLSYSRSPLAIMGALIVVYLLLRLISYSRGASLWTAIAVIVGVGFIIAFVIMALNSTNVVSELLKSYLPSDTTSLNGRLPLWRDTMGQILAAAATPVGLLLGHGFASFRFYGLTQFSYAGETHNAPLQVLYELGLVGICLWTVAVVSCFVQVWNRRVGLTRNLIRLLPLIYLIAAEMLDSSLADSRSFVLLILLLYSFRFRDGETAAAPAKRSRTIQTGMVPGLTSARLERT